MEELSIFNRVKKKSIYSVLGFCCKNNPNIEKLTFKHKKLVKFYSRFLYNQLTQFTNDILSGFNTVLNFYSKALSAVFIVTETGIVFKLDLYSKKLELLFNTHLEKVFSIVLMKNKYLLLASGNKNKKGCHMYDIGLRSFKFNFTGYYGETTCIQKISSTLFASGSSRNTIKIWNTDNQSLVSILRHHSDAILYLARTSKESLLSFSKDKTFKIWGLRRYECVKTIELGFTTFYISLLTKNEIILYNSCSFMRNQHSLFHESQENENFRITGKTTTKQNQQLMKNMTFGGSFYKRIDSNNTEFNLNNQTFGDKKVFHHSNTLKERSNESFNILSKKSEKNELKISFASQLSLFKPERRKLPRLNDLKTY